MVKWVLTGACIQLYIARKTRKTASNCRHPAPLCVCVLCEHPGLHVRPFGFKLYIKKTLRHRKKIQFPYQCCNWYDGAKCILYDWSFRHVIAKLLAEIMIVGILFSCSLSNQYILICLLYLCMFTNLMQ